MMFPENHVGNFWMNFPWFFLENDDRNSVMILNQTASISKYVRFSAHRVASINHFWMWLQQKKIFIQIPWRIQLIIFEDKLTRSAVILTVYIYEKISNYRKMTEMQQISCNCNLLEVKTLKFSSLRITFSWKHRSLC